MRKILGVLSIIIFTVCSAYSQSDSLDFLRSTGKIYSVIGGIILIFIGIAAYLIRLDNKLTKLEKHIKNE